MKSIFLPIVLAILCGASRGSVIPINPVATTYAVTGTPVVTAHSHQVVARHFNRVYVPTTVTYPGYSTAWGTYPYSYPHGYGYSHGYGYGYPYSYTYPYGTSVW